MGEFFPERVELELCNVIRCSPQFICICKDKYDNLYLCSSYYLDSLNMFGIAVIVSKQQLNDYINGINDDLISIFIKNSEENKYNKNAFETRFALMEDVRQDEKVRAMDVYINKIELNRQTQPLEKVKLTKIVPTPIAITNVGKVNTKENQLIVNMEESTMITTIINQNIYEVETMDVGSKEVLDSINVVENSYAKAYEICKNTTIYTAEMDTRGENEEFLQYIIPTIYKVAQRVQ